ncbi:hypothetical protein Nmel_010617 [Mimus melanotis]
MLLLESLGSCGMELASIILNFISPAKDSWCFIYLSCIPGCTASVFFKLEIFKGC